ncbi:MAG: hypothetical protein ACYC6M_02975 [Terriglobales bacterium]
MRRSTIWVVEEDEYNDYRVVGLYSTEANAKVIADRYGGTVAEWPIDANIDDIRRGYSQWRIQMLRDGTVESASVPSNSYDPDCEVQFWRRSTAPDSRNLNPPPPDCLVVECWARDQKHAVKIANEKRTQMVARGEWQ